MRIILRDWKIDSRLDTISIVPLGDIHIGAAACDETRLNRVVKRIAEDDNCFWIGMGDYIDAINKSDPRFDPRTVAKWLRLEDLADMVTAQKDHFLKIIQPIAHKCLGLVEGNHESAVTRHYERNIYQEIVKDIHRLGGFSDGTRLDLGYTGWLLLRFYRGGEGTKHPSSETIKINVHHGFTGGRLAGGKALNMQRWMWTHDADIVLFGHSHNTATMIEAVEEVIIGNKPSIRHIHRYGAYCGSFLKNSIMGTETYSEVKGYLPLPVSGIEIVLRPHSTEPNNRIVIRT